jgi:hypothetical protein
MSVMLGRFLSIEDSPEKFLEVVTEAWLGWS